MANVLDTLVKDFVFADGPLLAAIAPSFSESSPQERIALDSPDTLQAAHRDYLEAGSRILRVSAFQANRIAMKKFGLDKNINLLNWTASKLAQATLEEKKNVWLAGNIGPLSVSLEEAHKSGFDPLPVYIEQIGPQLDGGCKLVIFERFSDIQELSIAVEALRNLHHCPAVTCLEWNGTAPLDDSFQKCIDSGAEIMGVNATLTPRLAESLSMHAKISPDYPLAVFLDREDQDNELSIHVIKELRAAGVSLLGFNRGYSPTSISRIIRELS